MCMCRIGDAVRMAVATASAASEHPPGSDVAIRSKIQKSSPILPISPRGKPMCMRWHLRNAQSSSTQTIIGNLSATTLGWAQMPTHYHGSEHCLAVDLGYDVSALAGLKIALTGSGTNILSTTWSSVSAGSSASHTHGISNPNHTHTASTKIDTRQASRALHYIMRCA